MKTLRLTRLQRDYDASLQESELTILASRVDYLYPGVQIDLDQSKRNVTFICVNRYTFMVGEEYTTIIAELEKA